MSPNSKPDQHLVADLGQEQVAPLLAHPDLHDRAPSRSRSTGASHGKPSLTRPHVSSGRCCWSRRRSTLPWIRDGRTLATPSVVSPSSERSWRPLTSNVRRVATVSDSNACRAAVTIHSPANSSATPAITIFLPAWHAGVAVGDRPRPRGSCWRGARQRPWPSRRRPTSATEPQSRGRSETTRAFVLGISPRLGQSGDVRQCRDWKRQPGERASRARCGSGSSSSFAVPVFSGAVPTTTSAAS